MAEIGNIACLAVAAGIIILLAVRYCRSVAEEQLTGQVVSKSRKAFAFFIEVTGQTKSGRYYTATVRVSQDEYLRLSEGDQWQFSSNQVLRYHTVLGLYPG